MTPEQRNKMARRLGYKSFDEYAAKQKVYGQKGGSKLPEKPKRNVFESIDIHPAAILRKVSDKINEAVGQ